MSQKLEKSLQNRIFIQTLATLSAVELKTFKGFCLQKQRISDKTKKLFEFICKAAPDFEKLREEKILFKFFQNHPTPKKQLNYAFNDLMDLLQKWLIQQELEADNYLQNQLFIRACKKRFLHQQFFKKTRQTLETLNADFLAIPDIWHKQFETNFQLFYHVQTQKNQQEVESLSAMENNLELSYHGSKIRLLCQKIIRKKAFKNLPEIDEKEIMLTLDFAKKHQSRIPFFALYLQLIQYLQAPNRPVLYNFIKNFKRDRTQLTRLDQSILFYIAANSLNTSTMQGDRNASKAQFDLFQYAFDHNLVLFDNEIGQGPFNNFLVAACEIGEFKIAQRMLKKYAPYFNSKIRDDFTNLMWCTIFFHQKKYEKVELSLHQSKFRDPLFRVRSRNLFLKSLYERFQTNKTLKATILSELVNFRKYVQKQTRISQARKNMYNNMIFVIRALTHARHNRPLNRAKAKEKLTTFLSEKINKPISHKWLLEKIDNL